MAGAGARIAAGGAPAPGSASRVVLLDFGLARGLEDARLTMTGQFAGTPEYVSPEQAEGRSELTAATDLFSAGLVLCRALSDGPLAGGDSLSSQLAARRRGVPPRAREALGRATPRLARLIPWLLEREPRERPGDAGVALALLEGRRRRAPAWLRALRRRRVAVSLLAALLLAAAAAFVPLRIELQDGQPRRRSLLGVDLGGWDLPRQVDLPRLDPGSFGPGRWLVALPNGRMPHDRECMPEGYPSGLGMIRPWSRRIEPFVLWLNKGGMGERRIPQHGFAGYDQVFTPPSQVTAVPWPGEDGKRLFVAAYSHSLLMPGQIAVFDAEGDVTVLLDNPGRIGIDPLGRHSGLILLPPEPGARSAGLLVFLAGNLELGDREVYGAIRLSSAGSTLLQFPGVDQAGHSAAVIRYYFALDYQAMRVGARLEKAGAALRIVDGEGRLLRRFDPRTGIPLDAAERGGLDEQSWLDRVLELRRIFRRAAPGVSFRLDPEEGAALLEKFATDRAATAYQRGLALGRAAELSIEAGKFRHAAALARRALMQEPDHYHHARLLFQALTRSVGWRAARAAVIAASPTEVKVTVNDRDLAVAVAASGTAAEARALVSEFEHEAIAHAYYPAYCAMLLRLHLGEPTAALSALLAADGPLLDLPEFVFLQALALALTGPQRAAEARALLDGHESGFGSGNQVPIVPLAALLAEWGAGEGPSPPEIEIAVRRQHEAGRTNLLSWVFVPWAEALAARAALERGDEEAFTRHAAVARSAPGAGPWLELLLPRATGESRR